MNLKKLFVSALISISFPFLLSVDAKQLTDSQIKQRLIQESIDSYPGNCPCPYNSARNGSSCGRRSAYSRAGGYSPLCYPGDVNAQMVKDYRQKAKAQ